MENAIEIELDPKSYPISSGTQQKCVKQSSSTAAQIQGPIHVNASQLAPFKESLEAFEVQDLQMPGISSDWFMPPI